MAFSSRGKNRMQEDRKAQGRAGTKVVFRNLSNTAVCGGYGEKKVERGCQGLIGGGDLFWNWRGKSGPGEKESEKKTKGEKRCFRGLRTLDFLNSAIAENPRGKLPRKTFAFDVNPTAEDPFGGVTQGGENRNFAMRKGASSGC